MPNNTREIDPLMSTVISHLVASYGNASTEHFLRVHAPRNSRAVADIVRLAPPGSKICDVGAAPYTTAETLARLGYRVTTYDAAPPPSAVRGTLSVDVVHGDTSTPRLALESNAFDAVIMCEVFEHLHLNPVITMREVLRVLRPGGLLYLTTPNGLGLRKIVKVMREGKFTDCFENWSRLESTGEMGHVTEYTPLEIQHFIEKSGFANTDVKTENVYFKSNRVEHYFWSVITAPFSMKRETIVCTARKIGTP